jgi:hypothetical protein
MTGQKWARARRIRQQGDCHLAVRAIEARHRELIQWELRYSIQISTDIDLFENDVAIVPKWDWLTKGHLD